MDRRINIFGSSGIIGSGLKILDTGSQFRYFGRQEKGDFFFNISNPGSFKYDLISEKDLVLFLSALSKPTFCEKNPGSSELINVIKTSEVLSKFLERGATVIFTSSDTVYGSSIMLYNENSTINPRSTYAIHKSVVEEKFLNYNNFHVLRLSQCLNGFDSFSSYLDECFKNKNPIEINNGFARNIFDSNIIFDLLLKFSEGIGKMPKILNVGGDKCIDRLEFYHLLKSQKIPCNIVDYESNDIDRIKRISICNNLLKSTIGVKKITFNIEDYIFKLRLKKNQ